MESGTAMGNSKSIVEAYPVFISSTFLDLFQERRAVKEALLELNMPLAAVGVSLVPIDLQGGADVRPPLEACLQHVAGSELIVTIVGHRAGWLTDDGRSVTEREFDHATENGIPRLAYLRDPKTHVLPEHFDTDDESVKALQRFRTKIDDGVKRDTFRSPEHLRGHVLRDILSWILGLSAVKERLGHLTMPSSLPEIRSYLDSIERGDSEGAVELITSQKFFLDMRRFGTQSIHRELLRALLEFDSLNEPSTVIDPNPRSRLLLNLLEHFPDSSFAAAALEEAKSLEDHFKSHVYSFHVARAEAKLHFSCGRAIPALKRVLRCARGDGDPHQIAQARFAVADHYARVGDNARSKRWYWLAIRSLCAMIEICPHCISLGFLGAAGQELNCHECETTDNRLLKAYLAARVIPSWSIQATALTKLSDHLAAHGQLDESVACAVLAARAAEQALPADEEFGLPAILANLSAQYGRGEVASSLRRVQSTADEFVERLIDLHNIGSFVDGLGLKPSPLGDHW